jgi:hypothetical protein
VDLTPFALHPPCCHRRRLITFDQQGVTFKWKDYRIEGPDHISAARYSRCRLDQNPPLRHPLDEAGG